jgi:5-methylcytosine-specific restriction protein A
MFKFLDNFYRSPSWNRVRKEHLAQFPECSACGRKDNLEVHHIIPYHVDNSRELDPSNLITLCGKYCHFVFGHLMDWKSWNTNVVEDSNLYKVAKDNKPKPLQYGQSHEKTLLNIMLDAMFNLVCWNNRPK